MMIRNVGLAVVAATMAWAGVVKAWGLERCAGEGANRGEKVAGPLGAIVGGAAVGTANGILGIDRRERFRIDTAGERRPSFADPGNVKGGAILPEDGGVHYDVPPSSPCPATTTPSWAITRCR